jgi:nucleoside-triphosphatase
MASPIMSPRALLLTGRPGIGKTTVIRRLVAALPPLGLAGFYTDEIRSGRERSGFRAVTLDGWSVVIARVDRLSGERVGRYRVDVAAIDRLAERAFRAAGAADVILVDEIGKMECLSTGFVTTVRRLLDHGPPVIATVGAGGGGVIAEVKRRPDVDLWTVTATNRDDLPPTILAWLREHGRGPDRGAFSATSVPSSDRPRE